MTNKELYGNLPKISETICERRVRFSGHCWRSREEVVHQLILWAQSHGKRSRGRPPTTYIDQLTDDTGMEREELGTAMGDRNVWKEVVMDVRPRTLR